MRLRESARGNSLAAGTVAGARRACRSRATLRVYPNLRDRATAALFLRAPNAGMRVHRQVGKGREFERLREYMPGDSYEDIHWKATAHRRTPVVKLYQVEHAQEVYVVIDASRLSAREQILESYVTAALHLALVAERQGDRFGLITFSDRPHRLVRARSGMDHFRLCRETIYNLQAAARQPRFPRAVHQPAAQSAPPLAADLLHLAGRSAAGRDLRARSPAGGAPPPGAGERDAHRRIAAALRGRCAGRIWSPLIRLWPGRCCGTTCASCRSRCTITACGLSVVDPRDIKAQVTAAYLEVKRRQLL